MTSEVERPYQKEFERCPDLEGVGCPESNLQCRTKGEEEEVLIIDFRVEQRTKYVNNRQKGSSFEVLWSLDKTSKV